MMEKRPELTVRAILLGIILSLVMGSANVYLGLRAGMTVSASIPAAVVAMIILRGIFRSGNILEYNQVQTAASAGESLAAGIIFTIPALVIIGVWQEFDMVMTTAISFTGGILGILFMIPMRKVFIVSGKSELKFPEGLACAEVLRAGENAGNDLKSAMAIIWGALTGAAFKFMVSFLGIIKGTLEGAALLGGKLFYVGADVMPALVGVGYIVGFNISANIFIGGAMAWLIGIPIISGGMELEGSLIDNAWTLWSTKIRYVGVGAMVVGGVTSIYQVRHGLLHAIQEVTKKKAISLSKVSEQERDISPKVILFFGSIAVALTSAIYYALLQDVGITLITTALMIVAAFFFTAVASYIVGLVGNSNSPVSGMTITAVLFSGLMLLLFGYEGIQGMVATLGVAAIVCCVACTSGDVCNDLKTGQLVGASPFRQQIMQIIGVAVASLIMAPVLQLLHNNVPGGIGGRELVAPQAALFASLAEGFFGDGNLPWNLVGGGAAVGIAMVLLDNFLKKRDSRFRAYVMPTAVGMYLPFGLAVPILLGGLISYLIHMKRESGTTGAQKGVLFASGAIAGESLLGVGIAGLSSMGIQRLDIIPPGMLKEILTITAFILCLYLFYINSSRRRGIK